MKRPEDRLVYSTDQPFTASAEPKQKQHAQVSSKQASPPNDGVVRVARERRKAGTVTIIFGLAPEEIAETASFFKRRFGGGGTAKDGVVTLQGDHRDAIAAHYDAAKRRCKKMGG